PRLIRISLSAVSASQGPLILSELSRMCRDEVLGTHGWMSCYHLEIVGQSVVPIGGMKTGHSENVLEYVVRQIEALKIAISPFLKRQIDVRDRSTESSRALGRHFGHVQRFWPCKLINFSDMYRRVCQNDRDGLRDIVSGHWRSTT